MCIVRISVEKPICVETFEKVPQVRGSAGGRCSWRGRGGARCRWAAPGVARRLCIALVGPCDPTPLPLLAWPRAAGPLHTA